MKLKGFWSQIKDAPAEINHLIHRIDSLNLMLQHMQHDQSQHGIPELAVQNICMRRSLELCEECATGLLSLVNDLDIKVRGKKGVRKKIGSAKAVMSKEDIRNLEVRLDAAIQILSLSYQFHTNAMIQLQPEIILMRLKDHLTTSNILKAPVHKTNLQTENKSHERSNNLVVKQYDIWTSSTPWIRFLLGQLEYRHSHLMRRGKRQESIQAKYKLPELLSCYQVAFWAVRQQSGWWFTFECHRTLPKHNPFFEAVKRGDLAVVQKLLEEKKAYVTDRSDIWFVCDATALHLAAKNSDPAMCKLLLREGADPLAVDINLKTPLELAVRHGGLSNFKSTGNLLETCRVLLGAGADEILICNTKLLTSFSGPVSAFGYLQQQMYPPFHTVSAVPRLEFATSFLRSTCLWHNCAFIFQHLLMVGGSIDPEMVKLANESGQEFFHLLVTDWVLFLYYLHPFRNGREDIEEVLDETLSPQITDKMSLSQREWSVLGFEILFCKLISAGLSLRQINSDDRTLLSMMLLTYINHYYWNDGRSALTAVEGMVAMMHAWLKILLQSGVDLEDYGSWESTHFLDRGFKLKLPWFDNDADWWIATTFQVRLIKFDYGPRIEDWKFWFSEPSDPFAGDFWALIEEDVPWGWDSDEEESDDDEEQPMPGAWSEDF